MEPLEFTNESDGDNQLIVAVYDDLWGEHPDSVCVSVSDEKAVGSYNQTFECRFWLTREEAMRLRNWLTLYLNS